jgi:hypothetical protein
MKSIITAIVWIWICCYGNVALAQTNDVVRRIILIGDAGELHNDGHNPVIDAVRKTYHLQDSTNTILFLGDNVYPKGLPDPASPNYEKAREILDYQINLLRDKKANGIFIPGNHDWEKSKPNGWKTIRNQQEYVDGQGLPNVQFLPKDGCPGPIAVPLDNNMTLIIMDSEWWVFPYAKPGEESGCDFKNKDEVLAALADIVSNNRNKLLIFATHHPFRSYGIHGGYYTLKQHIFPLTDLKRNLYIPLPVIGSIYPIARGVFGTPEDLPHPLYQQMIKDVEGVLKENGPAIFVSGHDHSLQLINDKGNHYIVSGSGSKDTRVKKGPKSLFASQLNGFTVLEEKADSTVSVQFFAADNLQQPLFSETLLKIPDVVKQQNIGFTTADSLPAYVEMKPDPQYNRVKSFHRFLLGDNYRSVWDAPVKFPVLNLQKEKGGLKILQRGGGQQTRSLRLADSSGTEYAMRSLKKFPDAAVPEALRETIAKDVVQDQISASIPYGPLVVSSLAEAAGVPHTHPTFVYLPKDTALGVFASVFGDDVYLLEEREPVLGDNDKTYNTLKMLKRIEGDNDERVDQHSVLQARLLDFYIMDWDRHDDQWRWFMRKKDKEKMYYPIPRDRDQAFFVNNGLIPKLAARRWLMPKIQGFSNKIPDINGFNHNARYFDRSFMNELNESDWKKHTQTFLQKMTDSVLEAAVSTLPDTVYALTGPHMLQTLKERRSILEENALKYYRFISRGVDVPGTSKKELFELERLPDGKLAVDIFKISKKGAIEQNIYSRVFDPEVTKEVNLYGLGGGDRFVIKGDHSNRIKVRLIGGQEPDTYIDSAAKYTGKRISIYDLKSGKDSFQLGVNEKLKLSDDAANIQYNRESFKYNILMPMLAGGYNRDDGILLGLGLQYTYHSFRKEPFASRHTFSASHALATRAFNFKYEGEFTDVIGRSDLEIFARARAPHNTINFFGYGNETVFDQSGGKDISYYRARFNLYTVEALLKTKLSNRVNLRYGPNINYYAFDKDDNKNRFITNFPLNKLDSADVFQDKYYAGAKIALQIDTRNNTLIPSRGILWNTSLSGNQGLVANGKQYLQLQTDLSMYMSFRIPANLVIVSRFGGGINFGNYEFFQAISLGGTQNLRGFRNYRFSGSSGVYNNTEIRLKLFDIRTYILPGSLGLIAFNDIGRVWQDGETSHAWHDGFGGGIYFSPVNLLVITAAIGHSKEDTMPYFTFGFKF